MSKLHALTVKVLSLKTRVALLGALLGNKNAAGPHDGISGKLFPEEGDEGLKALERILPGVSVMSVLKQMSNKINFNNVSFWSKQEPKSTDRGRFGFDSSIGGFDDRFSKTGATFFITGTYSAAKQKALQQAATWGHNQLRIAP